MAEQNCHLVDNFLHAQRLSREEFYDVAVFGYLLAVKNGFAARTCTAMASPPLRGQPCAAASGMRGRSNPAASIR